MRGHCAISHVPSESELGRNRRGDLVAGEQTGLWFGLAGGGIGCVLGIGGAVVGAVLAPRARGRRLVVICMVVIALVGSPREKTIRAPCLRQLLIWK